MWNFEVPEDVTAEEAAAAVAAIEALLSVEAPVVRPVIDRWARAGRLEAQGLPVRGNESGGWRVRGHV